MEYAISELGHREHIGEAKKGDKYFCPCCGEEVIIKQGEFNAWHFAHRADSMCKDDWVYDMSEWHRNMQNYFDEQYREIVVRKGDEVHRADILKDGVVIEFQHSPISPAHFRDRNRFYVSCGYKVAWVFDLCGAEENGILQCTDDIGNSYKWNRPLKVLFDAPLPQDRSKEISICICMGDAEYGYYINRINWASTDYDGEPTYKHIKLCINAPTTPEELSEKNTERLFWLPSDFVKERTKALPRYSRKYNGKKGGTWDNYQCPMNQKGLRISECDHCGHCGFIESFHNGRTGKTESTIYCCYPNIVKEPYKEAVCDYMYPQTDSVEI